MFRVSFLFFLLYFHCCDDVLLNNTKQKEITLCLFVEGLDRSFLKAPMDSHRTPPKHPKGKEIARTQQQLINGIKVFFRRDLLSPQRSLNLSRVALSLTPLWGTYGCRDIPEVRRRSTETMSNTITSSLGQLTNIYGFEILCYARIKDTATKALVKRNHCRPFISSPHLLLYLQMLLWSSNAAVCRLQRAAEPSGRWALAFEKRYTAAFALLETQILKTFSAHCEKYIRASVSHSSFDQISGKLVKCF